MKRKNSRIALAFMALCACPIGRLHAQCPDGSPPPCRRPAGITIDSNAVAILPFRVSGPPESQYLREGMADLLDFSLDGVADWRVVHPRTIRSAGITSSLADPTQAVRLGRLIGAGNVVIGSAVAAGPELRVEAQLYDVGHGRRLAVVRARGELVRPTPIVDTLAIGLLRQRLLFHPSVRRRPLSEYTTASPAALQAFLVAEQLARQGTWSAAADSLHHAIALDSTFGLAYYSLYNAFVWGGVVRNQSEDSIDDLIVQASPFLNRLPERQRQILQLVEDFRQGRRTTALRRADLIGASYPEDPEVAIQQGETYFHFGLIMGEPPTRALESFQRALRLDPSLPESYQHATELLVVMGDTVAAWAVRARTPFGAPRHDIYYGLGMALRVLLRAEKPTSLLQEVPREEWNGALRWAAEETMRMLNDHPARGLDLAEGFAALGSADSNPRSQRADALADRAMLDLARGRYHAAWVDLTAASAADPENESVKVAVAVFSIVTGGHIEEGRAAVRTLTQRGTRSIYLTTIAALSSLRDRDGAAIEAVLRDTESSNSIQRPYLEAAASGLRGLTALRLGDSTSARALLDSALEVGYGVGRGTILDALLALQLARLDRAAGELDAARLSLSRLFLSDGYIYRAEGEELGGQIAEQRADTASALRAYRNFVALWENADPYLQPRVAAAREALTRLER